MIWIFGLTLKPRRRPSVPSRITGRAASTSGASALRWRQTELWTICGVSLDYRAEAALNAAFLFFHSQRRDTPDDEGAECTDLDAARQLAIDSIHSMIAEEAREGSIDLTGRIEIRDADGNSLLLVGYS
jgi:hypothetical protein